MCRRRSDGELFETSVVFSLRSVTQSIISLHKLQLFSPCCRPSLPHLFLPFATCRGSHTKLPIPRVPPSFLIPVSIYKCKRKKQNQMKPPFSIIRERKSYENSHLPPPFERPSPRQIGQHHRASAWKLKLSVMVWCVIRQHGCPASGQWVSFEESFKWGWRETQRTRAELCCKSWLCSAAGLVSWILCLCWSGWLQADVANEGGAVVRWHYGENRSGRHMIGVLGANVSSDSANPRTNIHESLHDLRAALCFTCGKLTILCLRKIIWRTTELVSDPIILQLCPLPTHIYSTGHPSGNMLINTASTNKHQMIFFTFPKKSAYTIRHLQTQARSHKHKVKAAEWKWKHGESVLLLLPPTYSSILWNCSLALYSQL